MARQRCHLPAPGCRVPSRVSVGPGSVTLTAFPWASPIAAVAAVRLAPLVRLRLGIAVWALEESPRQVAVD